MRLSYPNMLRILAYLKATETFKDASPEELARHLDKLIRINQFDAAETSDGKLIYACAWWRLTDRILEQVKELNTPKRIDRGRNIVGVFMINDMLNVQSMLALFRKLLSGQKARTLSFYSSRKKWVSVSVPGVGGDQMRQGKEPRALQILRRVA